MCVYVAMQLHADLAASRTVVQQLESQLKQVGTMAERRDKDFELAIKSRDETLASKEKLAVEVKALRVDHQRKVSKSSMCNITTSQDSYLWSECSHHLKISNELVRIELAKVKALEENLQSLRSDNEKLSATLQTVMRSHSNLQSTVETVQAELGQRDASIQSLRDDRTRLEMEATRLVRELDALRARVAISEDLESAELAPLRRELSRQKDDGDKMASTMQALFKSNAELKAKVESLEDELNEKSSLFEKTKDAGYFYNFFCISRIPVFTVFSPYL